MKCNHNSKHELLYITTTRPYRFCHFQCLKCGKISMWTYLKNSNKCVYVSNWGKYTSKIGQLKRVRRVI